MMEKNTNNNVPFGRNSIYSQCPFLPSNPMKHHITESPHHHRHNNQWLSTTFTDCCCCCCCHCRRPSGADWCCCCCWCCHCRRPRPSGAWAPRFVSLLAWHRPQHACRVWDNCAPGRAASQRWMAANASAWPRICLRTRRKASPSTPTRLGDNEVSLLAGKTRVSKQ